MAAGEGACKPLEEPRPREIVARMDGSVGTFHRVHGANKEIHHNALVNFADAELVVSAARDTRGVTRLAAFVLASDHGICGLVGPDQQL